MRLSVPPVALVYFSTDGLGQCARWEKVDLAQPFWQRN
jgi:hypothetical protein